ncbi:tRNA(Ile)-lysidine synthase TilS/MesJ [Caloramator fervidus]|uniref:tRNA(Ile)-lysidine synthase TilS/MesJ n=1 Tax=Caloramator fervidus TaxID=29344 RepID=A0A1H5WXD0_9CLOT|nr:ATP-binding protein [Caloramator fervidus]SEG03820.1 tRNA(Ile)-lysidine synthase TilS/MesJ [Caloramator fervidus]
MSIQGNCPVITPEGNRKPLVEIERSIITKFRHKVYSPFVRAIRDFKLIKDGDKIAVAISGGKDSLLMAKLFQELKRHSNIKFEVEFISMDPGYHSDIKKLHIENLNYLNIPAHIFESKIFEVVDRIAKDYPCYMCARMRRGALYNKAKELGCNKLALGHHYDDVIETILLNVLYSGNFKTMMPKLKAKNFEGMELIRPMYYIRERHIEQFIQYAGIWPLNCACMVAAEKIGNKRYEIKELIKNLKKNFEDVEKSIFKSAQNVNLDSIIGWQKDGKKYSFLEFYEE